MSPSQDLVFSGSTQTSNVTFYLGQTAFQAVADGTNGVAVPFSFDGDRLIYSLVVNLATTLTQAGETLAVQVMRFAGGAGSPIAIGLVANYSQAGTNQGRIDTVLPTPFTLVEGDTLAVQVVRANGNTVARYLAATVRIGSPL